MPGYKPAKSLFCTLFRKRELDQNLDDELQSYLNLVIDIKIRQGMNEKEARREALLEFGGVEQVAEKVRQKRIGAVLDSLVQDSRHAVRMLLKKPGLILSTSGTLALGIGVTTVIFSIVNTMLLRPLPYPAPDRLVTINHHYPSKQMLAPVSIEGFRNYRDNISYFEQTGISASWAVNHTGEGIPARITASRVTSGYLETFGLTLAEGRYFTPDEETPGNNQVVIISDGFWKRRLGGVPDVINRELQLNSDTYTIVGLMPAGFEDIIQPEREIWTPLALTAEQVDSQGYLSEWLYQIARVEEGVSIETVHEELVAMAEGLKETLSDNFPEDWTLKVTSLDERAKQEYRTSLFILAGAVGLILLITCANVANLLLARAIGRRKEIAIRGALGASRRQILQQLLTESVVLSGTGGLLGLMLAGLGIRAVVALGPPGFDSAGITIDLPVLLYTLMVSLLVGVLFGLIPALQISRTDIQSTLRVSGNRSHTDRSGRSLRKVLVAGEFAISLALLTGAGLLIQTMAGLQKVDPGFESENILTANISLPEVKYPDSGSQQAFYHELLPHLEALPGVEAASTTNVLPFGGRWSTAGFGIEGYFPEGDQPVSGFGLMKEMIAESIGDRKTTTFILVMFAGLAIMLASLGIYGVTSQMVNERTAELGVRLAFGATGLQLTSMVLKNGLVLATAGIVVGLLGSLGLSRLLMSQLYGVASTDPVTLASVTILLFMVATIATFLPALRAARLDPLTSGE